MGTRILIILSHNSDWELSNDIWHDAHFEQYRHVIYRWKARKPSFSLSRGTRSCICVYGVGALVSNLLYNTICIVFRGKTMELPVDVITILVFLEDFIHYGSLSRKVSHQTLYVLWSNVAVSRFGPNVRNFQSQFFFDNWLSNQELLHNLFSISRLIYITTLETLKGIMETTQMQGLLFYEEWILCYKLRKWARPY